MANHALFYNSVDHDRVYNADSFSDWLKKFFTTGVFEGDLFVTAVSGMTISVGTGYVNVGGKVMIYDTTTQFTLDPANGIYPRIDTVVVERNDTDRDFYLKVVTGDYSNLNNPIPTPPVRGGGIYQLVLAQIYVGAGVTEITQANITDTRSDPDLCGIVTGTVEEMDFSQFAAQFQAYYVEFVTGHEAEFEQWMQGEEDTFTAWVATLHDILDSETAGHLQLEIDALQVPTFTEASTRTNIVSGDDIPTLWGKVKKWFSDLTGGVMTTTTIAVDLTSWTQDTSAQSGTTLYKKQISLNNVYVESPTVDIGSSGVLPTVAEQESYNLLQYVTVDDTVPCLYLYASAIPTTAFYISVVGVD